MAIIDEQTTVRIGLVIILIGGMFSVSSVFFETKANSKSIESLQIDQKEEMKVLLEIREKVIRLEEKVK